jgi:hypothetical protein
MLQASMTRQLQGLRAHLRIWLSGTSIASLERDPEAIEIDRIRRDIDAILRDMPLITRPNAGPSTLLPERIRLLGLDLAYVETAQNVTFQKLQETCSACDSWRRCARDLALGDVAVGMERYCENAELLDALLIERLKG